MRLPVLALVVFTADLEFIIVSIVFILFWLMVRGAGFSGYGVLGVRGTGFSGYGVRGTGFSGYGVRSARYGVLGVRVTQSPVRGTGSNSHLAPRTSHHLAPLITSHLASRTSHHLAPHIMFSNSF